MSLFSIIGIILIICGLFFIGLGYRASKTLTKEVIQGIPGQYPHLSMQYLLIGGFLIFLGGTLFIWS